MAPVKSNGKWSSAFLIFHVLLRSSTKKQLNHIFVAFVCSFVKWCLPSVVYHIWLCPSIQ